MIYLLTLLALTVAIVVPKRNYHPELNPYIDQYMEILQEPCMPDQLNYPGNTYAGFVSGFINPVTAGTCTRTKAFWQINISRPVWDKLRESEKRELMFHELSHCILWKNHVENPRHYMYNTMTSYLIDVDQQVLEDAWERCGNK